MSGPVSTWMCDRLWVNHLGITSHLGQLSLLSFQGRCNCSAVMVSFDIVFDVMLVVLCVWWYRWSCTSDAEQAQEESSSRQLTLCRHGDEMLSPWRWEFILWCQLWCSITLSAKAGHGHSWSWPRPIMATAVAKAQSWPCWPRPLITVLMWYIIGI